MRIPYKKEKEAGMGSPIGFFFDNPKVIALASTRYHGNMRLGVNGGEDNRKNFMRYILPHIPDARVFVPELAHGKKIAVVDGDLREDMFKETDGVIVLQRGHVASVTYADCPPVLMAGETESGEMAVAAVHSGWRGTSENIAAEAVDKMRSIGVNHKTIRAVIGPSICGNCYEFGKRAPEIFMGYPKRFVKRMDNGSDKFLVDLRGIISIQLQMKGIRDISISNYCTMETPSLHSDRRDKKRPVEAGIALIGIRKY